MVTWLLFIAGVLQPVHFASERSCNEVADAYREYWDKKSRYVHTLCLPAKDVLR